MSTAALSISNILQCASIFIVAPHESVLDCVQSIFSSLAPSPCALCLSCPLAPLHQQLVPCAFKYIFTSNDIHQKDIQLQLKKGSAQTLGIMVAEVMVVMLARTGRDESDI